MRYAFHPTKSDGHKIVETDLNPKQPYKVTLEGQAVERQTVLLAGRFMKLDYNSTGFRLRWLSMAMRRRRGRLRQ